MKEERAKTGRRSRQAAGGPRQLVTILGAAAVALAARSSLADHYVVPSGSMLPTVVEGDRIVVDKLAYGLRLPFSQVYILERRGPRRGDVVVLASPESGIVLLKRVAAEPGDVVEVVDGRLVIDGRPVPVTVDDGRFCEVLGGVRHPISLSHGGGPEYGPVVIPPHRYLVLGDNRGDSRDGRFFGLVDRAAILGRAAATYFRQGDVGWWPL